MANAIENTLLRYSQHLDNRMQVYSGSGDLDEDVQFDEPLLNGIEVVVTNVSTDLYAGHHELVVGRGTTAIVLASRDEHERSQTFYAALRRRHAVVWMAHSLVEEEFGCEIEDLMHQQRRQSLMIDARPADGAIMSVATQLATMPETPMETMFRLGTGLNLAAMVFAQISGTDNSTSARLKTVDLERVSYAKETMRGDLAAVWDMRALAHKIGTNSAKFTRDFRSVTGTTPHAWLQEQRLMVAWQMLASQSGSVAEIAHAVGYAPAHFSTLFRRRFNASPSKLAVTGSI